MKCMMSVSVEYSIERDWLFRFCENKSKLKETTTNDFSKDITGPLAPRMFDLKEESYNLDIIIEIDDGEELKIPP